MQPIVCCLGDDVGGNPTQFVLERAFADRGLTDWKLFSAEIANEKFGEALQAFELLGIENVLLLTDTIRNSISLADLPITNHSVATWCRRATFLRCQEKASPGNVFPEKTVEKNTARNLEEPSDATVLLPSRLWEPSYSVGSAILQSILASPPPQTVEAQSTSAHATASQPPELATTELRSIVLGDSPTSRAAVAALVSNEQSQIYWRVEDSSAPLAECRSLELQEAFQAALAAERLKISSDFPLELASNYNTVVIGDESWSRELEKHLNREHFSSLKRIVDARSDVLSLSPLKLPTLESIVLIRQTDWLGKMLEEDILRLTGVAPNPAVVRDALDEYLEL